MRHSRVVVSGAVLAALAGVAAVISHLPTPGEGPGGAFSACFDPDFPPSKDVQVFVNQLMTQYQPRYYQSSRWSGSAGAPRALTWSLVRDGTLVPGLSGPTSASNLFSSMDAKFAASGGRPTWIAQIQSCFDRWAALTGTSYTRVTNAGNDWDDGANFPSSSGSAGLRGDCRVSSRNLDGGSNVLAFNFFPSNGGDMVLDSSENWGSTTNTFRFFRDVFMHEHGHGIGLQHVCSTNSSQLMEPFINTGFDGPQHDDLRGAVSHYGDAYESNGSVATATVLGTLNVGTTFNPSTVPAPAITNGSLTAISINGDVDFYRITTTAPVLGTVTLTPIGTTYDDSPQDPTDGTCPNPGALSTNSLAIADLSFEVIASNGSTVYQTVNAQPVGLAESLGGILLSPPGNFYVRVLENNSPGQAQLYTVSIAGNAAPTMSASDGAFAGLVRVTWTNIANESQYAVYRGTTNVRANALLLDTVAANVNVYDDVTAAPGVTYFYWVEATQGGGGSRPLAGPDSGFANLVPPPNNACAGATPISEDTVTSGTTAAATNDGQTTCGPAGATGLDVWYQYTAGCTGPVIVETLEGGTLTDTSVSVHAGCPGTAGNTIACDDDSGPDSLSLVQFDATAGATYFVRVTGADGSSGTFNLNVRLPAPANDECAAAFAIADGSFPFTNCGASTDGPSEALCDTGGDTQVSGDVWFVYTAAEASTVTAQTCLSPLPAFDTKLAVYAGAACPGGPDTAVVCNDDVCGSLSLVTFEAAAGQQFLLRVGGAGAVRGSAVLTLSLAPTGCTVTCDVNGDGGADTGDLIDLADAIAAGSPLPNPAACKDFNQDGGEDTADTIDLADAVAAGTCP